MNKKAEISIVILVFGVIAIFGFIIFSFHISNVKFENNFDSVYFVRKMANFDDKHEFYKNIYAEDAFLQLKETFVFREYFLGIKERSAENISFDSSTKIIYGELYSPKGFSFSDKISVSISYNLNK